MTTAISAPPANERGAVILEARAVDKYYGDDRTPVLDHVSVALHAGEFVALLGHPDPANRHCCVCCRD